jgi:hypothetical protein
MLIEFPSDDAGRDQSNVHASAFYASASGPEHAANIAMKRFRALHH